MNSDKHQSAAYGGNACDYHVMKGKGGNMHENAEISGKHVVRWAPNQSARKSAFIHRDTKCFKNLAVELYATDRAFHVFDANKVAFLEVDGNVFSLLKLLREETVGDELIMQRFPQMSEESLKAALLEIRRLQQLGYLLPSRNIRHSDLDQSTFEETLTNRVGGMTVHVTSQCNLACSYCIFGGSYDRHPELAQEAMSVETARCVVDFLIKHSPDSKGVRLDFFGGEPLLAFSLIKSTVEYLKSRLDGDHRDAMITIASNGTVLSDEILRFLVDHEVYLQFSVDGGRSAHDRERRFRSVDRGSYDLILRNLQRIHDFDANYFCQYVRIKSVITLASMDDPEDEFWDEPLVKLILREGHHSLLIEEPHYNVDRDGAYFERLGDLGELLAKARGVHSLQDLVRDLNWRQKAFFDQTFAQFMEVQAINQLRRDSNLLAFTKSCIMGANEGAVQTNGDIGVCHKASAMVIGNVNRGLWDFDQIAKLHNKLHFEWPECSSCFAARFCNLCYEKLDAEDANWNGTRAAFCRFTRLKHHMIFSSVLTILDQSPLLWNDMGRVVRKSLAEKLAVHESK